MKTFFLLVCVPVIALAQRPSDTSALVDSWAVAYGFEPELIHAIIEVESGGNPITACEQIRAAPWISSNGENEIEGFIAMR